MDLSDLLLGRCTVEDYLTATPTSCKLVQVSHPLTLFSVPVGSCLFAVFPESDTHALPFSCYFGGVLDSKNSSEIKFYSMTSDFLVSQQDTFKNATRMFVMTVNPESHEYAVNMIRNTLVVQSANVWFCMLDSTLNMQKVTTIRS